VNTLTRKVVAVGKDAQSMVGRTPQHIEAIRPLQDGVIADFDHTSLLLRHFILKALGKRWFRPPRVMICIPTGITSVEQNAVREAAGQLGKHIFLIEEPKAAAMGAGLDIFQPSGSMVVDIGGGTTDIAVLSLGGVVTAASIRVAGDKFDQAIQRYVRRERNLVIGERTAEQVKIAIGSVYPGDYDTGDMEVRGLDLRTGLPRAVTLTVPQVREAIREPVAAIVAATRQVLEKTPPELTGDIIHKGVMLTGGGALLRGMDKLLEESLRVPVHVAGDPLRCVVRGTAIALADLRKVRASLVREVAEDKPAKKRRPFFGRT
jgi:rod shape-determining protein MreB